MPLTVLILSFLAFILLFVSWLLGPPGNRQLKQRLLDFYVAVGEGDWSALYRYPASALSNFMAHNLGQSPLSLRYFLRTALISISATMLLYAASITFAYVYLALTVTNCVTPPFFRFLQVPIYMSNFLIFVFAINVIADYFSWSLTHQAANRLATARGSYAIAIVLAAPIVLFLLLYVLYSIYLPISIIVTMSNLGVPFNLQSFASNFIGIWSSNFFNLSDFFSFPRTLFDFACAGRPHTQFSISNMRTFQILAIETIMPIALFMMWCTIGVLAYLSHPISQRSLGLLLERLDSSDRPILVVVAAGVTALSALLAALFSYFKV